MNKIHVSIILCLLLALFGSTTFGQNDNIVLKRYRALLTSGTRTWGHNGILTEGGIVNDTIAGAPTVIARSEIRVLERYDGTKLFERALSGAALGCGAALILCLALSTGDNSEFSGEPNVDDVIHLSLIFGATGMVIGGFVGLTQEKWSRVPLEPSISFDPEFRNGKLVLTAYF